MFHVQKQHWMGCAIATAAMLTDRTYEEVSAASRRARPADLRWTAPLRRLLQRLTKTRWCRAWLWRARPVRDFVFPDFPVAAFIQDRRRCARFGQWIGVKGSLIHDPEFGGACHVAKYPRRDWYVAQLIQPSRPVAQKPLALVDRFVFFLHESATGRNGSRLEDR
jgi:hypothetical protein